MSPQLAAQRLTISLCGLLLALFSLPSCTPSQDTRNRLIVSVKDQKLLLVRDQKPVKVYPVSTSKFGVGSRFGSNATPLGKMEVAKKIGEGAPSGAVFKSRRRTGEVLQPNAPGRDPIVTRIMWLRGLERSNANTFRRFIYIHGTPEERKIGHPASYGCIRMTSRDIIDLYKRLGVGADVQIVRGSLNDTTEGRNYYAKWYRRSSSQHTAMR